MKSLVVIIFAFALGIAVRRLVATGSPTPSLARAKAFAKEMELARRSTHVTPDSIRGLKRGGHPSNSYLKSIDKLVKKSSKDEMV